MADLLQFSIQVNDSDVPKAERSLDRLESATKRATSGTDHLARSAERYMKMAAGYAAAIGGVLAANAALQKFIDSTIEAEAVQAKLAAVVRSTGGAAGYSAPQLSEMASALQRVTTYGDEAIIGAQTLLLTFKNIGHDVFPRATESVLDMATVMGTDLNSAAMQLGKALNDPIKGMSALGRAGVQFTGSQKEMVEQMLRANDLAGAQAVILKEVEGQMGGAARAARGTLGGALTALEEAFGDLFELGGSGSDDLRRAIERIAETVTSPDFVGAVQSFGTMLLNTINTLAQAAMWAMQKFQEFRNFLKAGLEVSDPAQSATMDLSARLSGIKAERDRLTKQQADIEQRLQNPGIVDRIPGNAYSLSSILSDMPEKLAKLDAESKRIFGEIDRRSIRPTAPAFTLPPGYEPPEYDASGLASTASQKAAEKARDAYDDLTGSIEQKIAKSELERQSMGLTAGQMLLLTNRQNLLQDAESKGIDLNALSADGTRTRREELTAYADKLTAAETATKRLQDAQEEQARVVQEIASLIGDAFSGLFDGPMEDIDAYFGKLASGAAGMGQQNIAKMFETGEDGEGGLIGAIFKATKQGSKEGSEEGSASGIMSLSALSGYANAAIGGLGIGYQVQDPAMGALGGAASGAMAGMAGGLPGMAIGAVIGGLAGFVGGMAGAKKALEEARKKVEEYRLTINEFTAAANGEQLSSYAKVLADFDKQAKELITLAEAAKDWPLVDQLKAANEAIKGTLGTQFREDLEASINRLSDRDWLNQAGAAQDAYNMRLKDAALLGVSADGAMTELTLSLQKIVIDAELTDDQVKMLGQSFPALADALSNLDSVVSSSAIEAAEERMKKAREDAETLVEKSRDNVSKAYEREVAAHQKVIDALKVSISSLQDFKSALQFDTALSPLDPTQRLMAAQSEFQSVSTAALGGDQDALGKLEEVSRRYLEEAKGYYASSEQYFSIFGEVNSTLDRALAQAQTQVSVADQQLAELKAQTGQYIDLNQNVQSLADAILALVAAQNAQRAALNPAAAVGTDFRSSLTAELAAYGVPGYASTITPTAPIPMPVAAFQAPAGNDNAAIIQELRGIRADNTALRAEVASLKQAKAAGDQQKVAAAQETTLAVNRVEKQLSMAGARR